MSTLPVAEAKARLSELLDRALAGEDVVISRSGRPLVRLTPLADQHPRRPGIAKGRVTDAFFEPLPEDELRAWEDS